MLTAPRVSLSPRQRLPEPAEQGRRGGRGRGRGRHRHPAAERHADHAAHRQPGLERRQAGAVRVRRLRPNGARAHRHQTQPRVGRNRMT